MPDDPVNRDPPSSWMSEAAGACDKPSWKTGCFGCVASGFDRERAGKIHDFFVAYLKDGVHVVALTPDDQVVMVRQFRAGLHRDSLETPGGLVEDGEDPCTARRRELLEETGYAGDPPRCWARYRPIRGFWRNGSRQSSFATQRGLPSLHPIKPRK